MPRTVQPATVTPPPVKRLRSVPHAERTGTDTPFLPVGRVLAHGIQADPFDVPTAPAH